MASIPTVQIRYKGDDVVRPGPFGIELRTPLAELRKKRLFLAVPMYGGISHGIFTRSAMELTAQAAHLGVHIQLYFLFNESLITRARNYCVDEFLRSNCTHMLFIDSDIGFYPQDVFFMLALQSVSSKDNDYDVLTAPYPKKTIAWEKIMRAVHMGYGDPSKTGQKPEELGKFVGDYVFNPKDGSNRFPLGAPVEVSEAGTGFMMIRRETLLRFHQGFPEKMYRPDHVRDKNFDGRRKIGLFFQAETERFNYEKFYREKLVELSKATREESPERWQDWAAEALKRAEEEDTKMSQRYLSEDYLFCKDIQKLGMKVWLCPWMQLQHAGSYVFGGSLADLSRIGAHATADVAAIQNPTGGTAQPGKTPSGLPPVKKRKRK